MCFMNFVESLFIHLAPIYKSLEQSHTPISEPSNSTTVPHGLFGLSAPSIWWCFACTETDPLCRLEWGQLLFCQWLLTLMRCINSMCTLLLVGYIFSPMKYSCILHLLLHPLTNGTLLQSVTMILDFITLK